jgi:hypothetical protein
MGRNIDPKIAEALKALGLGKEAVWDCHGTWLIKHSALEKVAASKGIKFEQPTIVASERDHVAMVVTGAMGNYSEWSMGEATPKNCKNAYFWAMAEKRAKDRVILKLVGLAGLVYSEKEAADLDGDKNTLWEAKEDEPPREETLTLIRELIDSTGTDIAKFCAYMGVDSIPEIRDTDKALNALRQKEVKNANS